MKRRLLILLIPILGFCFNSFAQGDLLVSPRRVVFEGDKQKEDLSLVNIGKDTATYSISFLQYDMKEDGSFVQIDKPDSGQKFADPYLRIFPRKITLAPGEPQVMVLQLKRKPDMQPGEYRSHLYFRSDKNIKPLGTENQIKDTTLKVELIPIYGLSIPIIIRSGDVSAVSTLSNLKLETQKDTIQYLKLTINRAGNISLYGDISIIYVPVQGSPIEIGLSKGIGLYTTINKRNIAVRLNTSGKKLTSGKLKVQYMSNDENKKPVVLCEGELDIK